MTYQMPPTPARISCPSARRYDRFCAAVLSLQQPRRTWTMAIFRRTVAMIDDLAVCDFGPDYQIAAAMAALQAAQHNHVCWAYDSDMRHEVIEVLDAAFTKTMPWMTRDKLARIGIGVLALCSAHRTEVLPGLVDIIVPYLDGEALAAFETALQARLSAEVAAPRDDLILALQAIARQRVDADAYLSLQRHLKNPNPVRAAQMLLAAGRAREAQGYLSSCPSVEPCFMPLSVELKYPRRSLVFADICEAFGKREDAQQMRWSRFTQSLSAAALRAFLARLPDFDDIEVEERAIAYAMEFPNAGRAVRFLIDIGHPEKAAEKILYDPEIWNDVDTWGARTAAYDLMRHTPRASVVLLRGRIRQILLEGAREFRREAAEDLRKLAEIAPVVEAEDDLPEGFVSHAGFLQRLDDICMLNDRVNFLKPKSKQYQRAA
jgi:hypothetical protein